MISSDMIRAGAALVHAVVGARLRLTCADGDELVVGRHPAADMAPCAFRQLVIEAAVRGQRSRVDPGIAVVGMEVGGSLDDLGGGVFRSARPDGTENRWLATTVGWADVRSLLRADESHFDPPLDAGDVEATIAPDPDLDVSLLSLDTPGSQPAPSALLDRVAARVSAALMIAELEVMLRSGADA